MFRHHIVLSSSYSEGKRICMHFIDDDASFSELTSKLHTLYGGKSVLFTTHSVSTESKDWTSIVKGDPYFEDIMVVEHQDEFIKLIEKDRFLKGIDVAKYILSEKPCTHTHLEKLTYMCYAEYLCTKGKKLFNDKIFAFEFGPVIDSVYAHYSTESRESPGQTIKKEKHESEINMAFRCRILFSEDGIEKIESIKNTINKYGDCSASSLVELTHRAGSPWDVTDKKSSFSEISDEDIIRCHHVEM